MLESLIEQKAGKLCKEHDVLFYKFSSPSNRGVPDRILVFPGGRVVFVEFKAPGKEPTALQQHTINQINNRQGTARWFNSYEVFKMWLENRLGE